MAMAIMAWPFNCVFLLYECLFRFFAARQVFIDLSPSQIRMLVCIKMLSLSTRRRRKQQVPFPSLVPFSPPNILKHRLHVWREMVSRICD